MVTAKPGGSRDNNLCRCFAVVRHLAARSALINRIDIHGVIMHKFTLVNRAFSHQKLLAICAASIAISAALTTSAVAQSSTREMVLEEIVVTAQKREQDLSEVPIHIQAFTAESLKRSGVERIEEIVMVSPTVTFTQSQSFDRSGFLIRGIGTSSLSAGVEPSVATVIDGVVMSRGGAALNELPDIERVEVLNGPQGMLFGKNASVGLINIITKRPNRDELEGSISATVTSDEDVKANFSVSAPLSDDLAFRLSGFSRSFDGNVKNVGTGNNVNGVNASGMRGKLLWDLSDNTEIMFSVDYSKQATSCCARVIRKDVLGIVVDPSFVNDFSRPAGSFAEILSVPISEFANEIDANRDPLTDSTNYGFSVEANVGIGEHTFTSLSAYREWNTLNTWDNDLTPVQLHRVQNQDRDLDWFTQEFRLTSPSSDSYDYILGLYYYKANTSALEVAERNLTSVNIVQYLRVDGEVENENYAAFGQLNVYPTDWLTLFGGLRVLRDEVSATLVSEGTHRDPDDGTISRTFDNGPSSNSGSDDTVIGKIGASFALNDDTNLFFSYSTGYKGQGFNTEFGFAFDPVPFNTAEPVAPEEVTNYEVGLKGTFLDQRLRLALTAYDMTVDGFQLTVRDLDTLVNLLGSVDEVTSKGVDLEIQALVTDRLSVNMGVAYNDATYTDFPNGLCYLGQTAEQGCNNGFQDLTGTTLGNAPEWKAILGARYETALGTGSFDGFVQGNYLYQSETYLTGSGDPNSLQDGYGLLHLSAGVESSDGKYQVTAFLRNATDEQYSIGVNANGGGGGGILVHQIPRDFERYAGVSFKMNF